VLYVDPNVSYMGQVTGGIRIRAPKPGTQVPQQQASAKSDDFDDDIPF